MHFVDPHVVASHEQEVAATKLNGEASTKIRINLETYNKYTAPYFNVNASSINVLSNFIDYQDSDGGLTNRNAMSTLDYVVESQPDGGTTASKHLTIPYSLQDTATSIRILVDATRPDTSDFTVWYRTRSTNDETPIQEKNWIAFSKTSNPPNASNYNDRGYHETFKQYEFNVYDISDFDTYQIKITINSSRSTMTPVFRNLRTIATI